MLDNLSQYDSQRLRNYAISHFEQKAEGGGFEMVYKNDLSESQFT